MKDNKCTGKKKDTKLPILITVGLLYPLAHQQVYPLVTFTLQVTSFKCTWFRDDQTLQQFSFLWEITDPMSQGRIKLALCGYVCVLILTSDTD